MDAIVPSSRTLRFGLFEVDLRAVELRKHGIKISLQEQPFHILTLLLEHPGELVTREELRQKLWSADMFVDFDRNLNKAMNKLRIALGDSAENPRFIETLHRRGYRFIAPLSAHENDWDHSISPTRATPAPISLTSSAPESFHRRSSDRIDLRRRATGRRTLALALAVVLIGLTSALYLRSRPALVFGGVSGAVTPRRSIAVLGFRNLSDRADQAWLSIALSDWLTTELSAGEQLRTVPAENVARTKIELGLPDLDTLSKDSLIRIGTNLSTDLVVSGSYASLGKDSGGQVRLDLRLEDTRTGETMAAISETGTDSRLFELVSRAGERLREKLGVAAITREEAAGVALALPSDHFAARLYSEGLAKLGIFDALTARDLFVQSIAAEPNFALSHSALSTAWATLGYDQQAKTEAKKAFDLSSELPRAERLLVEGRYYEASGNWEKAIEIYRALSAFFPDSLDYGLALARAQVAGSKASAAAQTVQALQELPPPLRDDPRIDLADDSAAEFLGDFTRDEASASRAAEKARALGASLLLAQARADQAWALVNLGKFDEASQAAADAKQLFAAAGDKRGVALATNLNGIVLQSRGDPAGAKKMYEESLRIFRGTGNELEVANELDNLGDVRLALGDLSGSRQEYEDALRRFRTIGHDDGVALATGALGHVLLDLGDHEGGKRVSEESLEICRQIGDRAKAAIALDSLALIFRAEGDIQKAQNYELEAASLFEKIGDRSANARAHLTLAELAIDSGKASEAAAMASKAAGEFEREKAARDESWAYGVLAQAFLEQGKTVDAQKAIWQAAALLKSSHDRQIEFFVAVTAARIQAASASAHGGAQNSRSLQQALTEAAKSEFVNYGLDARLASAQLDLSSGSCALGRSHLEAVEKDAAKIGFGLVAQEAAAAQKQSFNCSSR